MNNLVKIQCDDCDYLNTFKVSEGTLKQIDDSEYSGKLWFENECENCSADFRFDYYLKININGNKFEDANAIGGEVVSHTIEMQHPDLVQTA